MKMNIRKLLGLAAVAGLLAVVAPAASQAVSLASPGSALTAQHASENATTEVRWGRRRAWRRPYAYRRNYGWRPRYHRRRW